jgi:hypothetical protein
MKGVLAAILVQHARWLSPHPPHPQKSSAIVKAIAGMSGRCIISALISGSPFIPIIGDGPNTSTRT